MMHLDTRRRGGRNENRQEEPGFGCAVLSKSQPAQNTDSRRVPHGAGAVKHPFALPQRPVTGRTAMKSVASALSQGIQLWAVREFHTGDWQFLLEESTGTFHG